MKLKTLIKEASNDWTGGDLIEIKKQLDLCLKQATSLDKSYRKLEKIVSKAKKKPQGYQLWKLTESIPISSLATFKSSLINLAGRFKLVFPKNW